MNNVYAYTQSKCTHVHIHTHTRSPQMQTGCTALYLATQEGHEDVVELLLEAKADPELKENEVVHIMETMSAYVVYQVTDLSFNTIK